MPQPLAQPHPRQQRLRRLLRLSRRRAAHAAQLERHHHILQRRERGDELKVLKHETRALVSHPRALVLAQPAQLPPRQAHHAGRRLVEPRAQPEQGGLAATARPDQRQRLAFDQGKRRPAQHRQGPRRRGVGATDIFNFKDGRSGGGGRKHGDEVTRSKPPPPRFAIAPRTPRTFSRLPKPPCLRLARHPLRSPNPRPS